MSNACFGDALAQLMRRPDGCMQRLSLPGADKLALLIVPKTLPVYLMHTPALGARRRRMLRLLADAGAPDLTLFGCSNREDVELLSHEDRACLHPKYVVTHWSKPSAAGLTNGTLSLGLKHQLAYLDIVRRRLPAALLLEDDSTFPADIWARLAAYSMPADAHVFFAGSYSPNPRGGSLKDEDEVAGLEPTVRERSALGRNGTRPPILGSNAYVVTFEGASRLLQPVRAETDIQLSLLSPSPLCKRTPSTCYPALGMMGCGDPVACPIAPPRRQYGPTRWLIWQDPSARDRGSHNLLHGGGRSTPTRLPSASVRERYPEW